MDRNGHLYSSDQDRVQDALDAVFEKVLVASKAPRIDVEAHRLQTGA